MTMLLTNTGQNVELVVDFRVNGCCNKMNFWKCIRYTVDPYNIRNIAGTMQRLQKYIFSIPPTITFIIHHQIHAMPKSHSRNNTSFVLSMLLALSKLMKWRFGDSYGTIISHRSTWQTQKLPCTTEDQWSMTTFVFLWQNFCQHIVLNFQLQNETM